MAFENYGSRFVQQRPAEVVQPIETVAQPKTKVVQLEKNGSTTKKEKPVAQPKDAKWWKEYRKRLKDQRSKPGHCKHCGKKL